MIPILYSSPRIHGDHHGQAYRKGMRTRLKTMIFSFFIPRELQVISLRFLFFFYQTAQRPLLEPIVEDEKAAEP